jgi:adenylate kinase family enzyme
MADRDLRRVVVLGVTGSGKTTAGERIARTIGAKHIELDALYWGPDWTAAEPDAFRERVREAIAGHERWVTDGGYATMVMDITWARADALVWLDFPLWLTMWRLLRRTTGRIVRRDELWAGNRESIRSQFFSKDSLFNWAWTTHKKYQVSYPEHFARPELAGAHKIRFRRPSEYERWVRALESRVSAATTTGAAENRYT